MKTVNVIDRSKFIGGSDAAAVCAMSRWKTPLHLCAEKIGLIKEDDVSKKLNVKLGNKLEQIVCDLFTEETGKKLRRVNETIYHPAHSFIAANIDRRVVGEDAIFEAKTCSAWKEKEWEGEEIPQEYVIQCWHYLMVTGAKRCYLAVLIGNSIFKWTIIERNERVLADLLEREVRFWKDYVEKGVLPSIITHKDGDTLDQLYPVADDSQELILGDDANQLIENLKAFEADKRNLERLIETKKNELKFLLGESSQGTTGINQVRWVNSQQSRLDVKALLADLPDVHAKYYRTLPIRRFTYGPIKTMGENHG